jgi:nucleoside-diphosphate-sugar epimerase
MRRLIIVGCGFLGKAAALLFRSRGWEVLPVTNTETSAAELCAQGWEARATDVSKVEEVRALQRMAGPLTAWLHCASSGGGGTDAYDKVYRQGVENLLAAFPGARALFTSSTSVYGQVDGSVVTESSPAEPARETGRILLAAESEVLRRGGVVLRLAGLYGPGRSVLLRKFLSGEARLEAGGERWINQIHRDDAAAAWYFLADHGETRGIFNGADSRPMRQREIYGEMAARLERELPAAAAADLQRKRGWTSKRVSNEKLRGLGWGPHFPDYFADWERLLAEAGGGSRELP